MMMMRSTWLLSRGGAILLAATVGAQALTAQANGAQTPPPATQDQRREFDANNFAGFAAAVDALAPAGGTLVISTPQLLAKDQLVPAGVFLRFEHGGQLMASAPVGVTIREPLAAGRWQIFAGTVAARFAAALPEVIYPEWWGARGDNKTDDLAAFDRMTAAIQTGAPAHVVVQPTSYLSGAWNVDFAGQIEGAPGSGYNAPHLRFAPNSPGIVLHDLSTKTGVNEGRLARRSVVRNLIIEGAVGATTHTGTISTATGVITLTRATGTNFADAGGYHEGNTITVNNSDAGAFDYMIDTFVDSSHVTLKQPRLYVVAGNGAAKVFNALGDGGSYLSSWWVGQTLSLGGASYTISNVNNTVPTGANGYGVLTLSAPVAGLTANYAGYLCANVGVSPCYIGDATVLGASVTATQAMRPNLYHGLDVRTQALIDQNNIRGFAGNGLNFDSSFGPTAFPGTQPNQNVARVTGNTVNGCYGNGFYFKSTNSNQILVESNDATGNHGAGFGEFGFLGNRYHANHASFDYWGPYATALNSVNTSTFLGEYSEGGMPSAVFNQNQMIFGGDHGAGYSGGVSLAAEQGLLSLPLSQFVSGNGKYLGLRLGNSNQPNTLLGFGAAEDAKNIAVAGTATLYQGNSFQLGYDQLRTGWYSLYYGGNYGASQDGSVLAFSGSPAPEGAGKLWLYRGIDFIGPNRDVGLQRSAARTLQVTDGAGGAGNLTAASVSAPALYSPLKTDAFNGTLTLDFAQGNVHTITLTGDVTRLTLTNLTAGGEYIIRVAQDGRGGHNIAWANIRWAGGTPPRLSAGANRVDIFRFVSSDGTMLEEVSRALDVR
jgi:hypothetical protein